ncbi:unnamed protein product [Spirodela intermedia]|uniref:Uncharacterized protein n=1 Tax=Spirodela intermedia TaxID=51605 RepID=A0A7I8KLI2_SPIIN|nr:unnamed protein product [Spirodela intermedia]
MYAPNKEEPPQCHNVFRTKYTIDGKVCDLIIDCNSSENIISSLMVQNLKLKTKKHPHPYRIVCIKKNYETKVTDTILIKFSMGKTIFYEIYYDIVEMDACHLILDRSWDYDLDATHLDRDNHYIFYKNCEKFFLRPIKENKFFSTVKEKKI